MLHVLGLWSDRHQEKHTQDVVRKWQIPFIYSKVKQSTRHPLQA